MKRIEIGIIFFFAVVFCLPIFLSIPHTLPRLDTDYDAVLPIYQYIGNFIRMHHAFPATIPFVGTGIPILGDPVGGILNPLILIPLIFFDINISIRITIFLVVFFCGISMFLLLKSLKVQKFLQFWGAMLYMTSGTLISSVAAGHVIIKFLSLPFVPLFLLFAITSKLSLKKTFALCCVIAACIYSGDFYMVWFLFIFLFCIEIYFSIKNSQQRIKRIIYFFLTIFLFLLLSSPILYLFIIHVLPIMKRPVPVNPFLGSIQAFLLPLQFLMPLQVNFYDRPFFQRNLGFYYNWYEYYGFLGLFPVVFLKNIKKIKNHLSLVILSLLVIIGSLYVASAYFYSPFHWIFVLWKIHIFRVPQRIVIPLTSVVITLFVLCAHVWKRKKTLYVICIASLVWTWSVGWFTFSYTFVVPKKSDREFAKLVAKIDSSHSPVINIGTIPNFYLTQENIPILNYYYAWVPKNTPTFTYEDGKIHKEVVAKVRPLYVLVPLSTSLEDIEYSLSFHNNKYALWKSNK